MGGFCLPLCDRLKVSQKRSGHGIDAEGFAYRLSSGGAQRTRTLRVLEQILDGVCQGTDIAGWAQYAAPGCFDKLGKGSGTGLDDRNSRGQCRNRSDEG